MQKESQSPHAARRRLLLAGLSLPALLAGCSTLLGPRTLELSLAQLQQGLRGRLPLTGRYLDFFDVKLDNPRLSLAGGRLGIGLDAAVRPTMMQYALAGNFAVSGVPRIDLDQRAILLGQVKVDNLAVNGLNTVFNQQLGRLGNLLAERFVTDVPLYRFQTTDFQLGGARFQPTNINTVANGLVITFQPML